MRITATNSNSRFIGNWIILFITLVAILGRRSFVESAAFLNDDDDDTNKESKSKAVTYLSSFGYLEKSKAGASSLTPEALTQAITEYQEFYGLNQTGILDEDTVKEMEAPRCANPDKPERGDNGNFTFGPRRRKRQIEGVKVWRRMELTYRILNYPRLFPNKQKEIDAIIHNALNAWSVVTPFDFKKTNGDADIQIKWAVKRHCEGGDFDGPLKVLAHAFYPESGRVHFDDDEPWTISGMAKGKIDLYTVAVHEFGHTLGIEHKSDRRALMFPSYGNADKLHQIDITAIQRVYGAKKERPAGTTSRPSGTTSRPAAGSTTPATPVAPAKRPNLCKDASFDAITMSKAGKVFIFKGDWYWLLNNEADGVVAGYPRPIAQDWPGLPGSVDAVLTFKDGRFYFFKGNKYWRFTNRKLDDGYPKPMSFGFPGVPENIEGAFLYTDDKIMFFKGDQYWRFDYRDPIKVKSNYPMSITAWHGVPSRINDVFRWNNDVTYFFKDELYYRYNDETDEVESNADPPFPRSTNEWWLGCGANLSGGMLDGNESDSMEFANLEVDLGHFQSQNGTENSLDGPSLDGTE